MSFLAKLYVPFILLIAIQLPNTQSVVMLNPMETSRKIDMMSASCDGFYRALGF